MKYARTRAFFLVPVIAALLSSVQAQGIGDRNRAASSGDGRWSIQGRVYLPSGKPAVEAAVAVSSADSLPISTSTNIDGVFQVGGLMAGNYTVLVRVAGMPPETEMLTIDRDAAPGRTFNLAIYVRTEGRPGGVRDTSSPLLKDVPAAALEKFRKGEEKLRNNDPKAAIAFFDEAVRIHPDFAAAYFEKGQAQLKANDLDSALGSFVKAIAVKPNYVEAKYSVGYTQLQRKNYEVAAAVFDDVIKQRTDMPEAYMYLGISLYHLENVDAAEAALRSAIRVRDGANVALAHRFLGGIYARKDRNAEAAAELQKYLDLAPKAPDADRIKATIADLKKRS